MQKILVTGANEQLGSELRELSLFQDQYEWIFTDRQELDLSDLQNLADNITIKSPEIIINCAAYTAVDKAEEELELADVLNHLAVAIMAKWTILMDVNLFTFLLITFLMELPVLL